jgi:hypothetical protein
VKPPAAKLSITLLGPFLAEIDGLPLQGFRTAKVRALLAYLAVESHRALGTDYPRRFTLTRPAGEGRPEQPPERNLEPAQDHR